MPGHFRAAYRLLILCIAAGAAPAYGAAEDAADDAALAHGALPRIGAARLSPDGRLLLTLVAIQGSYQVGLRDMETGEARILLSTDGVDFRYQWCEFASSTRIVCSLRKADEIVAGSGSPYLGYRERRVIREHLVAVDVDGSDVEQLVPRAVSRLGGDLVWNAVDQADVIAWLPKEPDQVLIQLAREDQLWPSVYRLDIRRDRLERVRGFRSGVVRWVATPDGTLRLGVGARDGEPIAFAVREDGLEEIDLPALGLASVPAALGADATRGTVWFLADLGEGRVGLHEYDPASGRLTDRSVRADRDLELAAIDARSGAPLALRTGPPEGRLLWLDAELEQHLEGVAAAFPEGGVRLDHLHADAARTRILLRIETATRPPGLWLFEPAGPRLALLAPDLPRLDHRHATEHVVYAARDDLPIPAWLTLPGPREAGPWPTVILPHGGPWAHDRGTFDYWAQFLAHRGMAVLQPNFRGSTGLGTAHREAGDGEWGRGMQDDLVDGLDWLVDAGVADADRACIMGGSYGGYAALLASFRDTDRFRCALSYAGVSDLDRLEEYWRSFLFGAAGAARLPARGERPALSPIENAERVAMPLLVLHGAEDRVVTVEHSRRLVEALRRAGAQVRYVEQPHGDHQLAREEDRVEFLREIDAFLTRHLLD